MNLEIQDIVQFQTEVGKVESELRLRAIMAERRVMELEAQLAEAYVKNSQSDVTSSDSE
jgi:hypothetical protein